MLQFLHVTNSLIFVVQTSPGAGTVQNILHDWWLYCYMMLQFFSLHVTLATKWETAINDNNLQQLCSQLQSQLFNLLDYLITVTSVHRTSFGSEQFLCVH